MLRLYVVGNAPHSKKALENIQSMCRRHVGDNYDLDVVDVLREPLRALEDSVLVTPTLVKCSPAPPATLIGDLAEEGVVLRVLGLVTQSDDA